MQPKIHQPPDTLLSHERIRPRSIDSPPSHTRRNHRSATQGTLRRIASRGISIQGRRSPKYTSFRCVRSRQQTARSTKQKPSSRQHPTNERLLRHLHVQPMARQARLATTRYGHPTPPHQPRHRRTTRPTRLAGLAPSLACPAALVQRTRSRSSLLPTTRLANRLRTLHRRRPRPG